jgi:hypothetical protein
MPPQLPDGTDGTPPELNALVADHVDRMFDVKNMSRLETVVLNAVQTAIVNALGAVLSAAGAGAAVIVETLAKAEDVAGPAFNRLAAAAIADLFDVQVDIGRGGGGHGKVSEQSARNIGDALIKVFSGQASGGAAGAELGPSDEPAKGFLTAMSKLALEGWLEGGIVELCSLGQIETFGELDDTMSHVLGLGRASASVHGPLVNHLIVTPLEWKINKDHRPNLLSESEILKAFNRGDYTGAEAEEELARLGYSTRRQTMLLKSTAKRLSLDDTMLLARHGTIGRDYVLQNLRDEGFDQTTAEYLVAAAETKRFDALNDNSLAALKRAFVNGDITESALATFLNSILVDDLERQSFITAAQTERELEVRHLSGGEVIDCCKMGILPTAYYRAWLRRENYPEDEAFALELRLRMEMDRESALEDQRTKLQAERALEKQQKAADAAARKAAVDAERALHRRGSLGDLNRAAVRGLIPFARVAEVLSPQYDADTVNVMIALLEQDRQTYLEQQARADEARQRAGRRSIDVGTIEQAVLAGLLTIQEFRTRLSQMGFDPGDVALLAATLTDRQQDLNDAKAKQAAAAAAARIKHIDLGRLEQLVRRGVRSMAYYDAVLESLGFDAGARAAMVELLELHIADDAAAAAERARAANKPDPHGVTLELLRRAVILGNASEDSFQRFLVDQHFTSDAQALLLAELRDDVSTADAARRRREETEARAGSRVLSLDRVARAVRLGLISPAAYQARLVNDGYSDDDIAIELALLVQEIADVQATRAKRDAADQAAADRGLSLADVARAVKAGALTIDDYYARAAALGYSGADAGILVAVLNDELAAAADAASRRTSIDGELTARTLSIGQLEAAVKAGAVSIEGYIAQLESWGYGADDAELLAGLLVDQLGKQP